MKLIFKFILPFCLATTIVRTVYSREVILIENRSSKTDGELLRKILVKKFNLPIELIVLRNIGTDCELHTESIIHLCLDKNGNLEIRKFNKYIVENSLGVFFNQEEGIIL
jgi:hypothetical protein